jgi:hypothetical protein
MTPSDFAENPLLNAAFDPTRFAYIKLTPSAEVHRMGLVPPGIELPPDAKMYVLHLGDGTIIGLTGDKDSAYGAMVQNELIPVSLQ